jgi:integrase
MASIYKRKNENGTSVWRAVIRIKGHPSVSNHFERKQEADDWVQETERKIRQGQFNIDSFKKQHTYKDLIERLKRDGFFEYQKALKKISSQFQYWEGKLGSYALVHITSDLISKERQILMDSLLPDGNKRNPSTINRYTAVLSSVLGYATKKLRWMHENPCSRILKLKESSGRDRILSKEEAVRLLAACKESKQQYLYCIVLIALTTGARRGEILGLEWSCLDLEKGIAALKDTKNGKPRSVSLSQPVLQELQKLFVLRDKKKPLVFASKTVFGQIDIKKSWMEALKRAGIEDYHFHDLRHQFCTFAAGMGASNIELQTAMGHSSLQMLLRYTNLDAKNSKKFSDHISERILKGQNHD